MDRPMKYLFLCDVISSELRELIKNDYDPKQLGLAAAVFPWALIDGMIANGMDFDIISAPIMPHYPKFRKKSLPQYKGVFDYGGIKYESLPHSTVFYKRDFSIYKLAKKRIAQWCKENENREKCIIIYTLVPGFMAAAIAAKKRFPNLKICVIIADMIEDNLNLFPNAGLLKKIQVQLYSYYIHNAYKDLDYFVLLTKKMKNRIPCITNNYCILEGIYSGKSTEQVDELKKEKEIMYGGGLYDFENIKTLIEGFKRIKNKEAKLVLYGNGPLVEYVKEESNKNERIKYGGVLSHDDFLYHIKQAYLLINPRQPSDIGDYTFPSKIMEFLASGTPTLMYRIGGIPSEYYDHCIEIKGYSEDELAVSIDKALELGPEKLNSIGHDASLFILNQKNPQKQVSKIVNLIEGK